MNILTPNGHGGAQHPFFLSVFSSSWLWPASVQSLAASRQLDTFMTVYYFSPASNCYSLFSVNLLWPLFVVNTTEKITLTGQVGELSWRISLPVNSNGQAVPSVSCRKVKRAMIGHVVKFYERQSSEMTNNVRVSFYFWTPLKTHFDALHGDFGDTFRTLELNSHWEQQGHAADAYLEVFVWANLSASGHESSTVWALSDFFHHDFCNPLRCPFSGKKRENL